MLGILIAAAAHLAMDAPSRESIEAMGRYDIAYSYNLLYEGTTLDLRREEGGVTGDAFAAALRQVVENPQTVRTASVAARLYELLQAILEARPLDAPGASAWQAEDAFRRSVLRDGEGNVLQRVYMIGGSIAHTLLVDDLHITYQQFSNPRLSIYELSEFPKNVYTIEKLLNGLPYGMSPAEVEEYCGPGWEPVRAELGQGVPTTEWWRYEWDDRPGAYLMQEHEAGSQRIVTIRSRFSPSYEIITAVDYARMDGGRVFPSRVIRLEIDDEYLRIRAFTLEEVSLDVSSPDLYIMLLPGTRLQDFRPTTPTIYTWSAFDSWPLSGLEGVLIPVHLQAERANGSPQEDG